MSEQVEKVLALDVAFENFRNVAADVMSDISSTWKKKVFNSENFNKWFTEDDDSEESTEQETTTTNEIKKIGYVAEQVEDIEEVVDGQTTEPESTKPNTKDTDKKLDDLVKEMLKVCGTLASESPATTENVEKIKDIFREINELKDLVEKSRAARDKSINEAVEETAQPVDSSEEKSADTTPEQKSSIVESRVTGENGPTAPMM